MASLIDPISGTSASSSSPIAPSSSDSSLMPLAGRGSSSNESSIPLNPDTASSQAATPPNTPPAVQAHQSALGTNAPSSPTADEHNAVPQNSSIKEWRSWKIEYPYRILVLLVTLLFIFAITSLTIVSRRDSGFMRQSQPPGFLRRNPGLRKAIWEQGIFYTAFPAFIMTIYQVMWDATVMAFADRQPYVDLMKDGRHPRRTILLDYKMEPLLYRWVLAFRNKHFLLSACMLSSLVLTFGIVPLTSFLFTMDPVSSNSTFPVTTVTYFNGTMELPTPGFKNMPNLRLALDTAAGLRLNNLSFPPQTDGRFIFPKFTHHADLGSSNLTVQTAAYGVEGGCVEIPESEYEKRTVRLDATSMSIEVHAIDRMCAISSALGIRTSLFSPEVFMTSWVTQSCSEEAGWTRMSLMAARYDKASKTVRNFTLVSCKTYYFATAGGLVERAEPGLRPRLLRFAENPETRIGMNGEETKVLRQWLEHGVHVLRIFDPGERLEGNEFVKYVYRMVLQDSPDAPLRPEVLAAAAQTLFETIYAVFASIYLLKPRDTPLNGTGIYATEEKRLFVSSVVAYVILGVLSATAVLNVGLFRSAKEKSMLKEEPFGLMSYAGILYRSDLSTLLMRQVIEEDGDARRARETAGKLYKLEDVSWLYDSNAGRIAFRGKQPLQTLDANGNVVIPSRAESDPLVARNRGEGLGQWFLSGAKTTCKDVSKRGETVAAQLLHGTRFAKGVLLAKYTSAKARLDQLLQSIM